MLREDSDTKARAIAVVEVRPFWDADESFLAVGYIYRLDDPDQISVILN